MWRLLRRRITGRQLQRTRMVPVRERFAPLGDLPFWLCLILSSAALILALARPHGPATAVRSGGIDLVILQDGSASMHVADVAGNRWQRSISSCASSAIRSAGTATASPFYCSRTSPRRRSGSRRTGHLLLLHRSSRPDRRSGSRTRPRDTNSEQGIYWGVRLIERDEELHGSRRTPRRS
jgi:hypothetical protein